MAKVQTIALSTIRGFRGVVDFYYWRGIGCARSWPTRSKVPYSPAQIESRRWFVLCRADLKLMKASARASWPSFYTGRKMAWLDYYTSVYLRYCKAYGVPPPVVQSFNISEV